jgi:hypothetical protein
MRKFKHLETFENFDFQRQPERQTQPSREANPTIAPTKPRTKPSTRPSKPTPTRRYKPAVDPKPKAELEDVIDLFDYLSSDEEKQEIVEYYKNK